MPSERPSERECDLLVVGSGAGGLSAAATAAVLGLRVLVLDKAALFGGTTAWSGGWMWVPRNPLARAAGIDEPLEAPLTYLRHELGDRFDEARARRYLALAPRMVAFMRERTLLRFVDGNAIPDFHGRSPGAAEGGRSVCAAPFDGRRLGAQVHRLRPPLAETTLWGMGIASGADLRHFLDARHAPGSFVHVLRRVTRHALDRLRHGRGLHLVNGNALAAALAATLLEAGGEILTRHPVRSLVRGVAREGCGPGWDALADTPRGPLRVRARRGVVLACGGFPHDLARRQALLPHAPTGHEHWSAAVPDNAGDGLRLGESAGGRVDPGLAEAAALAPVSLVPRRDGAVAHFPHLIERAKPGLIAVAPNGRRFVNEADSYHDFTRALIAATPAGEPPRAWLVCDHAFIRRYGLGAVKPAPLPLARWLANGYLQRGRSLDELAGRCGLPADALRATVERYNGQARQGRDPDFAKGDTLYNRVQGDRQAPAPNPCMAPLVRAPFYAVRVQPGSLGTFAGLQCDPQARVLDRADRPIPGLYACGNDMNSIMGGHYPSGGITLGPAMTYGWIAAHDAAGLSLSEEESACSTTTPR